MSVSEPFKFKVGDRVASRYKNSFYKCPGEFASYTGDDGSPEYSVTFDDGNAGTNIKEKFMVKEHPTAPKRPVSISAPLVIRDLVRTSEMGSYTVILRHTPDHENLIPTTDSEVLCRLVGRWVGRGGRSP